MTTEAQELQASLDRKQEIDELESGKFIATHQWLIQAVELLLRLEIGREKKGARK
jgi:hypothetical protein